MSVDAKTKTSLARRAKDEVIVDDVIAQIVAGTMKPGERLRTYRELCAIYGVGQAVLTRALDELETRGIVVRVARSGCFIAEDAAARIETDAAREEPVADERVRSAEDEDIVRFNLKSRRAKLTLRFFLSDAYPEKVRVWTDLAREFEGHCGHLRIEIRNANTDYIEDYHGCQSADVLQATPSLLGFLGPEQFVAVSDLTMFGLEPHALSRPARQYVEQVPELCGVPSTISYPCLFVNTDLSARLGVPSLGGRCFGELAAALAPTLSSPAFDDCTACLKSSLFRTLVHDGAFRLDRELRLHCDAERARNVLEALETLHQTGREFPEFGAELFLSGRCLAGLHFAFQAVRIRPAAQFAWERRRYPCAPDAQSEAKLLLLAVRRDSALLPESVDLVHFLSDTDSQKSLASVGDCLPVRTEALQATGADPHLSLPEHELRGLLDSCSLLWVEREENRRIERAVDALGDGFGQLRLTWQQALARLDLLVDSLGQ